MKAMLDAQDVWETVESAEKEEFNPRKDKKARAYILQSIPEDVLLQIAKKKTAKEIWESLKTRYLSANRVKKARLQILKNEFDALRMKEHESIDEFARKVREAPCRSKRRNDDRQYTDATPDEPALLFFMSQEKTRGRREMFLELDEKITGKVRLDDGNVVQVKRKGMVVFQCKNEDQYILHEVYYIPKLCTNIISLGQMTENESEVNMVGDAIKVYDNGKLLMFVKRTSNRPYKISWSVVKATERVTSANHSPPTAGEASPSTSTLRRSLQVPDINTGEFRRRRWRDRRRVRTRRQRRGNDNRHIESSTILDPQDNVDLKRKKHGA
ncbi:hypothetical protein AKJ16_DCAP02712 [Drosera capensis]